MALDLVLGIITTIVEHTIGPIIRYLSYAFKYETKVNNLMEEVKKLSRERESLQLDIQEASSRGDEIANYVTDWEARAEKAIEEAGALIEGHEEEAKKRCFFDLCPNFMSRYKLGLKADEETSGITKLQEEKGRFGQISYRPPLRPIVKPPVEGYEAPSRAKILKDIMEALMDPNVNMVGVYGMGGVGKTTLAKELLNQAIQDKSFDKVVMAPVSATPMLNKIQAEITDKLDFRFDEESEDGRAQRLHQMLTKEKKYLFILDDLWKPLELQKVGIPSGNDLNGSKIFLTSRSVDVLSSMGSRNNFGLQVLSEEEARILFEMKVGEVKDANIAKEIVLKCAGHPLSVDTVAGLLRDKDLYAWKDILKQLSRFDNQEIQDKIYSVVELSYDYMVDEELKSLFLLCGLLGQSEISILDLLKYCVGLGFFKRIKTAADARNRLLKLIGDLKSSSLLLEYGDGRKSVNMHDIVRDTAASIASRSQHAFTIKNEDKLEEWPSEDVGSKCTRICLPYCDIHELPEDLKCPEVEFFLFFSKGRYLKIPDSALEGTKKLKVLNFTGIRILSLPMSLGFLANLRTLCLHDCQLRDVTTIGQLKRLEILSFRGSMIEQLPSEVGQLSRLKSLDLSHCSKLEIIPANVISRLSLLEELYMGNSFVHWEPEEHNSRSRASLSELTYLSKLTTLEIQFPSAETIPKDLFYKNLEWYQIFIGNGWQWDDDNGISLKTLKLKTSTRLPSGIERLLKGAENLELGHIKGIRNVLFDLEDEGFKKLKRLQIQDAFELQYIVDSTKFVRSVFPLLESLYLQNLTNLQKICREQPSAGSFSQLKHLGVYNCRRLKLVLSLSMVRSLSQLERLSVGDCRNIEGIIVDENDSGGGGNEVVEFAQLRYLHLWNLPQLRVFVHKAELYVPGTSEVGLEDESGPGPLFGKTVAFPRLEDMYLSSIANVEEIWHSQLASGSFSNLKSLTIFFCDKLRTVFPAGVSGRFIKLEKLNLWSCSLLEEIYQLQGLHLEDKNATIASELRNLKIECLPKLKHIWGKDPPETFTCENLQVINIEDCGVLKYLFPSSITKSLSQLKELVVRRSGVQEIIAERECVGPALCFLFPQLTSLKLSDLPHMRTFYCGKHTMDCPKLKCLTTSGCDEAEVFLSGTSDTQNTLQDNQPSCSLCRQPVLSAQKILTNLEELSLDGKIFKMILHSPFWIELLSKLKSLQLCSIQGKLLEVSIFEFFRGLPNLETLVVSNSYLTELVRYKIQSDDKEDTVTLAHSRIRSLKLDSVEGLKHVWKQASQKDPLLSSLETLDLRYCWDLITLSSSLSASFKNLTSLEVKYCRRLVSLVTMSTAKSLSQLVKMRIGHCKCLKEIVVADEQQLGDGLTQEHIIFNKLKTLELDNLPSLTSFCMANCTFEFLSLVDVRVKACPNMKIFTSGILETPMLENINVKTLPFGQDKWRWDGDVNATVRQLFKEMDGFHGLGWELKISKFPKLIEKWHGLGQLPFKFSSGLSSLVVDQCALLSIAVPSNVLPLLHNISELVVKNCDSVEEVFNLEGLDIAEGHVDLMSQLSLLELNDLPKLRHIWIGDPLGILCFRNLSRLDVHSCGLLTSIFTLAIALGLVNLEFLEVKECAVVEVIVEKGEEEADWDRQTIFPSLRSIKLESLPNLTDFYPGGHVLKCPSLCEVSVVGCPKIPVFASSSPRMERDPSATTGRDGEGSHEENIDVPTLLFFNDQILLNLEKLSIDGKIFKMILHSPFWIKLLSKLKSLQLCSIQGKLHEASVFEFFRGLPNLETFVVSDSYFTELFRYKIQSDDKEDTVTLAHSRIRSLKLDSVEGLKHVWKQSSHKDPLLSSLETLDLRSCVDLITLSSSLSASFKNLTSLEVKNCRRLVTLVTMSTAKSLSQLVKMKIGDCDCSKEIVVADEQQLGDGLTQEHIIFNKLKTLELDNLPSLTSFCMANCTFEFLSLAEVRVDACPNMKIFTSGILDTPMLENINAKMLPFSRDKWRWDGDLNATIRQLFKEMDGSHRLSRELTLSKFPQLIEKWQGSGQLPFEFSSRLRSLAVDQCALLSIAVPSNVLPLLCDITKLVVEKCDSVEEVFNLEGLDIAEGYIGLMSRLRSLELKDLPKLRHIWIRDPLGILDFRNLSRLKVHSCGLLTIIFTLATASVLVNLKFLKVKKCDGVEVIIEKGEQADWDRQTIFPSLRSIKLESLPSLRDFYPGGHVLKCPSLNEVSVVGCPKMPLYATSSSRMERDPSATAGRDEEGSLEENIDMPTLLFFNGQVEIPMLEKVTMEWNSTMNEIWHKIFPAPILFRLEVIELKGFPAKCALLPSNFLRSLPNLKILVVRDYFSENIFSQAVKGVEETHHESIAQLKKLLLFNLPKIEHLVGKELQPITLFQYLETLEVTDCGALKNLAPYSASFQNLMTLVVSKCNRLTSLVTFSMARGLVKLERLILKECEAIREIVSSEGDGVENDVSFDRLTHLELSSLPYLSSFSSGNYTFNFPWLEKVVVRECPGMKIFAKNILSTPMLEEVQVAEDEEEWQWEGSLNGTIEKLFTKKVDELQSTIEKDQKNLVEEIRMASDEHKSVMEDANGGSEAMAID